MASCVGKKPLVAFDNCPGVSVAITRPGFNRTVSPFQIYLIDEAGNIQSTGNPINLQINAFGLNNKDGFLYGLHESANISTHFFPGSIKTEISWISENFRLHQIPAQKSGSSTPQQQPWMAGIIIISPQSLQIHPSRAHIPTLFLGKIENVSKLKEGDEIKITYKEIKIGTCADEILSTYPIPPMVSCRILLMIRITVTYIRLFRRRQIHRHLQRLLISMPGRDSLF